ncbi:MAG: hypothetical protein K8963_07655, partial [Proteobacteria bacterium]|nr:hypothetical protein [Pseudomonadota bacterium]
MSRKYIELIHQPSSQPNPMQGRRHPARCSRYNTAVEKTPANVLPSGYRDRIVRDRAILSRDACPIARHNAPKFLQDACPDKQEPHRSEPASSRQPLPAPLPV